MALAYINEHAALGMAAPGAHGQALQEPATKNSGSPLTFTTSAQSGAFGTHTTYIAFNVDAAAHFVIGSNPTATTNDYKIPANIEFVRAVKPGEKIAFIAA